MNGHLCSHIPLTPPPLCKQAELLFTTVSSFSPLLLFKILLSSKNLEELREGCCFLLFTLKKVRNPQGRGQRACPLVSWNLKKISQWLTCTCTELICDCTYEQQLQISATLFSLVIQRPNCFFGQFPASDIYKEMCVVCLDAFNNLLIKFSFFLA